MTGQVKTQGLAEAIRYRQLNLAVEATYAKYIAAQARYKASEFSYRAVKATKSDLDTEYKESKAASDLVITLHAAYEAAEDKYEAAKAAKAEFETAKGGNKNDN